MKKRILSQSDVTLLERVKLCNLVAESRKRKMCAYNLTLLHAKPITGCVFFHQMCLLAHAFISKLF